MKLLADLLLIGHLPQLVGHLPHELNIQRPLIRLACRHMMGNQQAPQLTATKHGYNQVRPDLKNEPAINMSRVLKALVLNINRFGQWAHCRDCLPNLFQNRVI